MTNCRIQSGAVTPNESHHTHRLHLPPLATFPFSHSNSTTPPTAHNPISPGSRWRKGKLLDRGTFGDIYLGFNKESGEMSAMKEVTLFSYDAKSRESAMQLMRVNLFPNYSIPNIVQYYGSETVSDKLCIYLEYVGGGSIYKQLQQYGEFGELAIRSFTQQILEIKGAIILVDSNGQVKLADFGMAKHITGQSCPLSFKGSPCWMAPEVVTKNPNDCNLAVDIWSLGCTVLEMATTKPPWSNYEGVGNSCQYIGTCS
ncbi:Mitogen-activated protein kinase kinase kinase YODA [Spatholobus suberectus]|nr:Mitogen-activated protein kinase kinase kinase YODA [Spatholobus suberectus]